MDYADRLRTATMGTLLRTFEDQRLYAEGGGVDQVTPDRLLMEQHRKETNQDGGVEEWIYATEIEVTVRRRRLH